MNQITFYLLIVLLFACNQPSSLDKGDAYYIQIKNLKTDKEKNDYLHNLWNADQNLRGGQSGKIITEHGIQSKEHKQFVEKSKKKDNEVFLKLKAYLEIHGYPPNPTDFRELAINAFPIIIGHNHDFKSQKELLPYLYNAYKQNHCSLDDVVWVLGEMHESKYNGRRYEMSTNKFTTEQEFKELVDVLGLNYEL